MSETGEWLECCVDSDYEIFSEYPYPIRRKGSDKIIKESIHRATGYFVCYLNKIRYLKHRIIGLQFIDNDDPEQKTVIDHRDHNRANNHIENIRWVSQAENLKNKSSSLNRQYTFYDELPETAEPLDSYNGHDLDGVYVDYEEKRLYLFNGIKYRELVPCRSHGSIIYTAHDIENKWFHLYHKVLFG